MNVRGILSKLNLKEIQKIVKKYDVIGLTETLTNAFDYNEFEEHEVFTGMDKLCLKGHRGLALLVRRTICHNYKESPLGLWLEMRLNANTYSIGLYYMLCENSRYWDSSAFEKIQEDILQYKNPGSKLILMGDFNARTGNLIDYIDIYDEEEQVPPRLNRDLKVNTNGRLLIDLCKTTEMVLVNGRLNNRNSGDYTCITHNGESVIDYFVIDYDAFDDVNKLSVLEFDPCLSDVHCPVAMELKNLKHVPVEIYEMNQKTRRWNKQTQERFYQEIIKKDLTALEILIDNEVNTLNTLNEFNTTLRKLICESASRAGALRTSKGKTTFTSNNGWFDRDCQSKRSIFRKRLRWANKWNDKSERKAAFREYKYFLRQKRRNWIVDTNSNLRRKKSENPKSYWSFFKKLDSKDKRIPIELTKMYNHFKNLNSTNVCSQTFHSDINVNDELNKAFTENEVTKCIKKIKNGKSAGLDNIYPEFIKYIPDSLINVITKFFNRILETTEVPDDWAISIYQPVFKKGNRNDPNNYRGSRFRAAYVNFLQRFSLKGYKMI